MSSLITDKQFKTAMGQFITGVTIVSCIKQDGNPYGLTVNSFASVSLSPRLVLWSLIKGNSCASDFEQAQHFSIAFLAHEQTELCGRFSTEHEDRFKGVDWHTGHTGAPVIAGALRVLECRSWQQYDGGDHIIHVGEVLHIHEHENDLQPMSYFSGKVNDI